MSSLALGGESLVNFSEIRNELNRRLDVAQRSVGSKADPKVIPWTVFRDNESLVERLYIASASMNAEHIKMSEMDRKFRQAVLGESVGISRSRILAIVLSQNVSPTSDLWCSYLKHLRLEEPGKRQSAFCDEELPFTPKALEDFFGPEAAQQFYNNQHLFESSFTNRFEQICEELSDYINEAYITCENVDKQGNTVAQEYNYTDRFCPDYFPARLVARNERLVRDLYIETERARSSWPRNLTEEGVELEKARNDSVRFYKAVRDRAKVLSILVEIGVNPHSQTWARFIRLCLQQDQSLLRDEHLPLTFEIVAAALGKQKAGDFCERQWRFCPAKLREEERSDIFNNTRLPLSEKREIGEGSYGKVFSVKVVAGHYCDRSGRLVNDDKELAMKQIQPRESDEWEKIKILFEQKLTHTSIMRARAGLKGNDSLFIFFELADCDLYAYMTRTEHNALGPDTYVAKREMFGLISDVAGAIQYLHCNLESTTKDQLICYHKDLKAENILVTYKRGKILFQITDFGISSIKQASDFIYDKDKSLARTPKPPRTQQTRTLLGENCPNFAPEALSEGRVTASNDVWAFGTVLAEFVAWMFGGRDALCEFEDARRARARLEWSFELDDSREPVINSGIQDWYEGLLHRTADPNERRLYKSCWQLLKDKLLVCSPQDRAEIVEVCRFLHRIYQERDTSDIFEQSSSASTTTTSTERSDSGINDPSKSIRSKLLSPKLAYRKRDRDKRPAKASTSSTKSVQSGQTSRKSTHECLIDAIRTSNESAFREHLSDLHPTKLDALFEDKTALAWAIENGQDAMACELLREGADATMTIRTSSPLIHQAIDKSMPRTVIELAHRDGNVDCLDQKGATSLVHAVRMAKECPLEVIQCFLERNANLEALDSRNATPLLISLEHERPEQAKELISHGADLLAKDKYGWTALHYAVRLADEELISLLLDKCPSLAREVNKEGSTALHQCADLSTKTSLKHAQALLNAQADPNAKDSSNRTALFVVSSKTPVTECREQMVDLLMRGGASIWEGRLERPRQRQYALIQKALADRPARH